jgi:Cu+-exporting ATPase
MTCAACSGTIERALQNTRGIYSAKVSLLTERCEVVYDEHVLTAKKIVDEIEDVGFEASVSSTGTKGKITLLTSEHLTNEKRARVYKTAMEQVGVLNVVIQARAIPPHHDVLEVEFDAKQHELCGPGGSKPIVWQGTGPAPTSNSPPRSPKAPAAAPVVQADALGRFSIRALVKALAEIGLEVSSVRNDGDLETRKAEMAHRRQAETDQWRKAFLQSLLFTVPIAVICWIMPFIPAVHESLSASFHRALTVKAFVLWLLVTPVQFGFGMRFYRNSYKALKHRSANMDVLVALGSSASYFYSLIVCIMCLSNDHYAGNVFFETSALLISIVLLGRYVENKAKGKTSEALSVLMGLQASTATLLTLDANGDVVNEDEIDVNLVQFGDILHVHRGGKIPVDGVIVSEQSTSIDEALLTGESMPVTKSQGESVIGGTINLETPIRMRATGVGSDTVLFRIVSLVNDAQNSKAPIQAYADYIGSIFVPCVIALSTVVFIFWYSLCLAEVIPEDWKGEHENSFLFSFLFSVSVLLISCPCSLGLATPTAVMVGTGVGATLGVLFKGGEPLEITGKTKVMIFDKTGTLTEGKPSVCESETWITGLERLKVSEEVWWLLVGSLAHQSEHLMSRAIATHAQTRKPTSSSSSTAASSSSSSSAAEPTMLLDTVHSFVAQSGGGCLGTVRGKKVLLGNRRFLTEQGVQGLTEEVEKRMDAVQVRGNVAVLVAIDGELSGVVSLSDAVKPEAALAVRALQVRGIVVYMLTGDNARSARAIGEQVCIPPENVIAQVTPADKAEVVKRIQQTGGGADGNHMSEQAISEREHAITIARTASPTNSTSSSGSLLSGDQEDSSSASAGASRLRTRDPNHVVVAFCGDGINDAGALAQADVGISIGSGTDIALETAQVVLMKSDLCDVITAIDLSQATLNRIRRNFAWACIYNLLSIPIAAGVFYPLVHKGLPPIVAAMCMGLSSISVIASSLLLKRYRKPILADEDGGLIVPPASPPTTDFTMPGGFVVAVPEDVMRWVRRARGYAFSSLAQEEAGSSPLSQMDGGNSDASSSLPSSRSRNSSLQRDEEQAMTDESNSGSRSHNASTPRLPVAQPVVVLAASKKSKQKASATLTKLRASDDIHSPSAEPAYSQL